MCGRRMTLTRWLGRNAIAADALRRSGRRHRALSLPSPKSRWSRRCTSTGDSVPRRCSGAFSATNAVTQTMLGGAASAVRSSAIPGTRRSQIAPTATGWRWSPEPCSRRADVILRLTTGKQSRQHKRSAPLPNIRSQSLDSSGLSIVASDGRSITLTRADVAEDVDVGRDCDSQRHAEVEAVG